MLVSLDRCLLLAVSLTLACASDNNEPTFSSTSANTFGDATSSGAESVTDDGASGDGDSATTAGDGDTTTGDGTTGDGDGTTGDGTTGDGTTGDGTTGDGDGTTGDGTTGDGTTGDGTTGDGDGTTGDGTTGDGTTGDGDGTTGDGDGDGEMGCRGVDFLFVIDNSGSMGGEQAALIASFDGFINTIESTLATLQANSYHIMVTDTDAASIEPDPACTFQCVLTPGGSCNGIPCSLQGPLCLAVCSNDPTAMCGGGNCSDLAGCGASSCACELGAGVTETPTGMSCNVTGGATYLQDGQPDLTGTFSCIADVGTGGSGTERQMDSMMQAIGPLNAPGECNQGFQRDDAILVITIITDEEDVNSMGDPAAWRDAVLAAKNNDEAGVVVLGLVGDTNTPNAVCGSISGNDGAEESPRLRQFVSSMQNNVLGSVCESDYTPFFQQAVQLIEDTCVNYPQPQ